MDRQNRARPSAHAPSHARLRSNIMFSKPSNAKPTPAKNSKASTKAKRPLDGRKLLEDNSQLITTALVAIASFTLGRVFSGKNNSRSSSRGREHVGSSDDHAFENAMNIPHLNGHSPARFDGNDEEKQAYLAERALEYDLQLKQELMEIELSASSAGRRMMDNNGLNGNPYAAYAAGLDADDSFLSSSALDRSYDDVTQSPMPYVPMTP